MPAVTEMSLRAFHLLFIALSVVLTAFFAAWAAGQYQVARDTTYAIVGIGSLAAGVALTVYGARFQRKTRHL
jgi:ABC-type Mn2+/Zn2+ transport system permease subunit